MKSSFGLLSGAWIEGEQAQEQGTSGLTVAVTQDRKMRLGLG